jgi:hypothetical protein
MNTCSAVTSTSCNYISSVSDLVVFGYGCFYKDQNWFIFMLLNTCHTEVYFKLIFYIKMEYMPYF